MLGFAQLCISTNTGTDTSIIVGSLQTESSSKASEGKFTRVLKLIRPWEICSPDIAAAVEFCRDRVIEMSEEEFELIFQSAFPAIERPATAPAKVNSAAAKEQTKARRVS